ncbi:MAG: tryptophan--tRNA ligase [Christensenellales bacterium]|jgi:tryptophanyl-tRNA synthetase
MNQETPIIFSGIQPSGVLTLGNYLGALRNWKLLEADHHCYYCVVDLHAITIRQQPASLRRRCVETIALLIACGLSPQHSIMYCQSHVSAHAELSWVLNCHSYLGELGRMTQFKDKSARQNENINAGLLNYPVLMAADILLYQANLVPVGADQKQHLELTRDIALRFNNLYGETFTIPEGYFPKVGARIMSLQEPDKKMSKSDDNENAYISMLDAPDTIVRKVKRAVTDSGSDISFEGSDGVVNLLTIFCACTGQTQSQATAHFQGKGYGQLKADTAEAVIQTLSPIQTEYKRLLADKAGLQAVMNEGSEKAARAAYKTLNKVYRKVGLAPKKL